MSEHKLFRRDQRTFAGSHEAQRPRHSLEEALMWFVIATITTLLVCVSAAPTVAVGAEPKQFGIASFSIQTTKASPGQGLVNEPYSFTQAAGHPFALTSTVQFANEQVGANHTLVPTRNLTDMMIDLPPGLVADPQATPRCSLGQAERCPTDTQVGVFAIHASILGAAVELLGPIVNVMPTGGQSAELALETQFGTFLLAGRVVSTAQGYTIAIEGRRLPALGIVSMEITLWGVPAYGQHDPQRGLSCIGSGANPQLNCEGGGVANQEKPVAFLTMPSSCSAPTQPARVWADSGEEQGRYVQAQSTLPVMASCERLPFSPQVTVKPDAPRAAAPVGVDIGIQVPQIEHAAVVAAPPLRNATVTLPQGMSINPSVANGLQACNATGPTGIDMPTGLNTSGEPLSPEEVGPGEEQGFYGEPELVPGHCPEASTVGTVEALSPLLPDPIKGRVYLATPGCGGEEQSACTEQDAIDGNLYRLYIELGGNTEKDHDVLLKLEARVQANPITGQLTVQLTEMPQLPLSELNISLFGGPGALLANPTTCEPAMTSTNLEPWSAPLTSSAQPSIYYDVTGCSTPPSFDPGFLAGTVNVAAGAFTAFTLTVTHSDQQQDLAGLTLHAPPGLSAMLSSVPLCPQALTSTGQCPEASRVGGSEVFAGVGSQPLYIPGNVYLTGPYEGAPFGLAIVTNAVAGPMNLGVIVIRARIEIDPQTAALTITSDPLPQIVLGIPLHIQRVTFNLNRPRFIFNPTNCQTQQVSATITGAEGASAGASNPFALGDCKSLAFKPKIAASTRARTSLANGASLDVRVTLPNVQQGAEANLARIKVALPRQLATRLTSLQNSCPVGTFDAHPPACPSASIIGNARARTRVLHGELAGPVYLVSRGRNVLPSPVVVLQADGVILHLLGSTTIDKSGIASVAFNATPDLPLERIELVLPAGPDSLLAANTSLCAPGKLITVKRSVTQRVHGRTVRRTIKVRERLPATLPLRSELAAHNGAVVHQTAQITVTGCTASQLAIVARSHSPTRSRAPR